MNICCNHRNSSNSRMCMGKENFKMIYMYRNHRNHNLTWPHEIKINFPDIDSPLSHLSTLHICWFYIIFICTFRIQNFEKKKFMEFSFSEIWRRCSSEMTSQGEKMRKWLSLALVIISRKLFSIFRCLFKPLYWIKRVACIFPT